MSRRSPPFTPINYATELARSGKVRVEGTVLHIWNEKHWQALDGTEAERNALDWIVSGGSTAPEHASARNARAAVETAVLRVPALTTATDIVIVPVGNGYLHVKPGSRVLEPHDPEFGIRHVVKCDYDPAAPRPEIFLRFLNRVLPDTAVQKRVQEYVGYTLTSDCKHQRAQLWTGAGANGKGVFANIVQALHGKTAAARLDALEGFLVANLLGASLIYVDEIPRRGINEQMLKSLIAGESVLLDRKHRDPVTARVTGKWIVLGNHIPAVSDQSYGFWRRWDIVPFDVVIPEAERDPDLASRIIRDELAGVLLWALEGLQRLLARGRFDEDVPAAIRAALNSARLQTDSVAAWIDDEDISLLTDTSTPKADVYGAYAGWCKSNGMIPVASAQFWKRINENLTGIHERRIRVRGDQTRVCNVRLRLRH